MQWRISAFLIKYTCPFLAPEDNAQQILKLKFLKYFFFFKRKWVQRSTWLSAFEPPAQTQKKKSNLKKNNSQKKTRSVIAQQQVNKEVHTKKKQELLEKHTYFFCLIPFRVVVDLLLYLLLAFFPFYLMAFGRKE